MALMNKKLTLYINLAALGGSMALLAGCSDDFTQSGGESDFKVSARTSYLRTKTNALSFGADGGAGNTRTIRVETYGTPWVIEPQADWVKVSPENGTGTQDVTVTVEPNPSADVSKHTFLTLKPASSTAMPGVAAASWKVNVDQESPAAFLDAAIEQKSPGIAKKLGGTAGSSLRINVNANCEWQVVSVPEWASYETDANGIILNAISQNIHPESRTGSVVISYNLHLGEPASKAVTVTQDVLTYDIPLDYQMKFDRQGETKVLKGVRMEGDWRISGENTWAAAWSTRNDDGTYDITVRALENTDVESGTSRSAVIVFYSTEAGTINKRARSKIYIEQDPYIFEFTGTAQNDDGTPVTMKVGDRTARVVDTNLFENIIPLNVHSNCNWMFGSTADWVNVGSNQEYNFTGPSHGEGDNKMRVNVWPNKTAKPRTALFHLSYPNVGGKHEYVNVRQKGASFSVYGGDEGFLKVSPSGGEYKLDISGHGSWSMTCDSEWVKITSPMSGVLLGDHSSDIITLEAEPLISGETRSCSLTFWLAGIQRVYKVVQYPGVSVSGSTLTIDPDAAKTHYLTLRLDRPWKITTDADWLRINQMSGQGSPDPVDISIGATAKNPRLNLPRMANLSIEYEEEGVPVILNYQVIQESYSLKVSGIPNELKPEGGSFKAVLSGSVPITKGLIGYTYPDWLELASESVSTGSNNSFAVTFNYNARTSTEERKGDIVFWQANYPADKISIRVTQPQLDKYLIPEKTFLNFDRSTSSQELKYISSSPVTVSSDADWIEVEDLSDSSFLVCVVENTGAARVGYVKLQNDDGYSVSVKVVQESSSIWASPVSINLDYFSQETYVRVFSDLTVICKSYPAWVTVKKGAEGYTWSIDVGFNNSGAVRQGKITFENSAGNTAIVTITQTPL